LLDNRLREEGVNIDYLQEIPDYTTGIAFIAYSADGSREFVFHLRQSAAAAFSAEQLSADYFADVSWLHVSGSTLFLSNSSRDVCARALSLTKAAGGKLSLDPNLRPELLPVDQAREVLDPYLEAADLLLPTAEEARLLTGINDDEGAAGALMKEHNRIVILKRGREGASVFTQDGRFDIPGFSVSEIDPTGAGDCFNAGFIAGLEAGWPVAKAGSYAAAAGALAVTQQGPMEGAPANTQVDEFLKGGGETVG
jgi:fructokinase